MRRTLEVVTPCPKNWDEMTGSESVRYCGHCRQSVYNLAAMSEKEVDKLLVESDKLPCMRITKRADGTILTRDCAEVVTHGWAAWGKRGLLGLLSFIGLSSLMGCQDKPHTGVPAIKPPTTVDVTSASSEYVVIGKIKTPDVMEKPTKKVAR